MPKVIEIPDPTDASSDVLLEVRGGANPRVTVSYRGDVTVWEGADLPNGMRVKMAAALKAAVASAKGAWGY